MSGMQGQSRDTEEKERGFGSFFGQQCRIVNAIFSRWEHNRYLYFAFDAHAGSGWNDQVEVVGSPLLFCEVAANASLDNYRLYACEKDARRAAELRQRTQDNVRVCVVNSDNAQFIAAIPDIIRDAGENPQYALGHVLLDPNSAAADSIPWKEVASLAQVCPCIDIAFNYPALSMKRADRACRALNIQCRCYVDIEQLPDLFCKRHMYIRSPIGDWHFTLVVGRNASYGDHPGLRIYRWNSEGGRQARLKARLTEAELAKLGQRFLFPGME